ncbi:hypothetical protein [Sphingomonas sp.]|uniref:hypothetical protein n=1 Tax=Sphingomonas sp. TaxID=28214 RepID=UPI003F6E6C24
MRLVEIEGAADGPLPQITIAGIETDESIFALHEGKWVPGRYPANIRIDRNSHFADVGDDGVHGHVYGRNRDTGALVVVTKAGKSSHGKSGKLHSDDAAALRKRGFDIPPSGIIEWFDLPDDESRIMLCEAFAG